MSVRPEVRATYGGGRFCCAGVTGVVGIVFGVAGCRGVVGTVSGVAVGLGSGLCCFVFIVISDMELSA